jgi:hypothetical protein
VNGFPSAQRLRTTNVLMLQLRHSAISASARPSRRSVVMVCQTSSSARSVTADKHRRQIAFWRYAVRNA